MVSGFSGAETAGDEATRAGEAQVKEGMGLAVGDLVSKINGGCGAEYDGGERWERDGGRGRRPSRVDEGR